MPTPQKAKKPAVAESHWPQVAPYAVLSLVCFLCGVGVLLLMLFQAERLYSLGLIGHLYYIILLPLGLAVAGFLFGVLRSFARYTGKQLGGKLELGGPIVAAVLVVIGGFWLPKPAPEFFDVTVFIHGEEGEHDLVLRNTGNVWMTLGADRRQEKIGDKGQADFKGIPANFRGQLVAVSVEAEGFEPVKPDSKHRLDSSAVHLAVRRKGQKLSGRVIALSDFGSKPVTNATVRVADLRGTVDADGHFTLALPGTSASANLTLEVNASGFQSWREQVVPAANEITVILKPAP